MLLFKGMEELGNIVEHAKQRHHIIGQYVVGREGLMQDVSPKDQGASEFLKQFYTSNYFWAGRISTDSVSALVSASPLFFSVKQEISIPKYQNQCFYLVMLFLDCRNWSKRARISCISWTNFLCDQKNCFKLSWRLKNVPVGSMRCSSGFCWFMNHDYINYNFKD